MQAAGRELSAATGGEEPRGGREGGSPSPSLGREQPRREPSQSGGPISRSPGSRFWVRGGSLVVPPAPCSSHAACPVPIPPVLPQIRAPRLAQARPDISGLPPPPLPGVTFIWEEIFGIPELLRSTSVSPAPRGRPRGQGVLPPASSHPLPADSTEEDALARRGGSSRRLCPLPLPARFQGRTRG